MNTDRRLLVAVLAPALALAAWLVLGGLLFWLALDDAQRASLGTALGPILVTWHEITTLVIAASVALGLRLIMFQTRAGVTMRAVVDHRGLATLVGARPARSSMLSWALGSSLAAVAGILLAPVTADAIARLAIEGEADPVIRPFGIERFVPARAAAAE